jgi:hypothetical protein
VVVGDDYADGACGKVYDGDGKTPECAGETRRVSAGAFGKDIFLAILFPCFCRIFTNQLPISSESIGAALKGRVKFFNTLPKFIETKTN